MAMNADAVRRLFVVPTRDGFEWGLSPALQRGCADSLSRLLSIAVNHEADIYLTGGSDAAGLIIGADSELAWRGSMARIHLCAPHLIPVGTPHFRLERMCGLKRPGSVGGWRPLRRSDSVTYRLIWALAENMFEGPPDGQLLDLLRQHPAFMVASFLRKELLAPNTLATSWALGLLPDIVRVIAAIVHPRFHVDRYNPDSPARLKETFDVSSESVSACFGNVSKPRRKRPGSVGLLLSVWYARPNFTAIDLSAPESFLHREVKGSKRFEVGLARSCAKFLEFVASVWLHVERQPGPDCRMQPLFVPELFFNDAIVTAAWNRHCEQRVEPGVIIG